MLFQGDDFIHKASPNSNMSRPLILHDNDLYLVGLALGVEPIPDHTQLMNAYSVNLTTDEVQTFLPRPSIYNQGQYGILALYQLFCNENLDRSGKGKITSKRGLKLRRTLQIQNGEGNQNNLIIMGNPIEMEGKTFDPEGVLYLLKKE